MVIGYVFNYHGRTVRDMEKRLIPLNLARRIDLDIILNILDTGHFCSQPQYAKNVSVVNLIFVNC